jgi:hypothetical protein
MEFAFLAAQALAFAACHQVQQVPEVAVAPVQEGAMELELEAVEGCAEIACD